MEDVTVISSSIVKPGNISHSGQAKIHLTPSDLSLLYLDYPQRGLLFHKPDPQTHFISRLKSSLSTTLETYFPFTGSLVKVNNHEDNTVSLYIDCDDGRGVKFVHAIADSVSGSRIEFVHHVSASYRCCAGILYWVTYWAKDLASSNPEP
ncbi:PREDICTED: uncharacterized acetyltransferase At3g50280-like [Camelina sativa]|uniref:Uncharacterized acetyltransferase At3g50280-like n=1 Tax=Camelina sativa TaxID=90675 RepID=A0ABM0YNP9_CAMSA|nr:PREDICTED: uncharacterized acetyltransferase At3g50280-like [Camelina sativa]